MLSSITNLSKTGIQQATPRPALVIIGQQELDTFSRFVYRVYEANNAGDLGWEPNEEEVREFIEEDEAYFPSSLYVAFKTWGEVLLSTLKITQYKPALTFPIQKQFGIEVEDLAKRYGASTDQFFHLGRLCVDKARLPNGGPGSRELFTRMLYRCLFFTTWVRSGHIFAEAAEPAVMLFEQIGLPMDLVGDPQFHTGTQTYPVVIPPRVITAWLAKHKHLA